MTADSLDTMFEKRYEYLIKQKEKLGLDFEYENQDDAFGGEILTFSSQNYDKSKFDIETLKQKQKQQKEEEMQDQDFINIA